MEDCFEFPPRNPTLLAAIAAESFGTDAFGAVHSVICFDDAKAIWAAVFTYCFASLRLRSEYVASDEERCRN